MLSTSKPKATSITEETKQESYFPSDILRLILHSAATRDLHAVQGISQEFKKLAKETLRSRRGFIFRTTEDSIISQVRIFFDEKKQIALEVKSKKHKLPLLLPIKDKKADTGSENIFDFLDNPLHIKRIHASGSSYEKDPLRIEFSNDKPALLLNYSPPSEAVAFHPTENEKKLINAINANDTAIVTALLNAKGSAKVSPNTRDHEGVPVLVLAASYGDLENVKCLVEHGANLESRSAKGVGQLTALLMAACYIDKKPENKEEKSPAFLSHEYKLKEVMMFLAEKGARVDAQANTGNTILHYVSRVEMDNTKEITFLLSKGADPTQVNLYDRRPTDYSIHVESLVAKNMSQLYVATIHTTPVLYCSHWSRQEDGSTYSIHFKPGVWSNKKFRTMDVFASKVKSIKTEDPFSGGVGLANDYVDFEFPGYRGRQSSDLPIPTCVRYVVYNIAYEEEENCMKLYLRPGYKDNKFVHRAIEKMFLELKLGSSVELTAVLATTPPTPIKVATEEKKSDSVYTNPITQFQPAASTTSSDEKKNKTKRIRCCIC